MERQKPSRSLNPRSLEAQEEERAEQERRKEASRPRRLLCCPRGPSIQTIPALVPKVCKSCLLWAIWIPRVGDNIKPI